jgi:hypothetical protein
VLTGEPCIDQRTREKVWRMYQPHPGRPDACT